jgi:hypothetical protein
MVESKLNKGLPVAEQLVLSISKWEFVVVHNCPHTGELDFPTLGNVVVLEVGFQKKSMFADHLAQPSHKSL